MPIGDKIGSVYELKNCTQKAIFKWDFIICN